MLDQKYKEEVRRNLVLDVARIRMFGKEAMLFQAVSDLETAFVQLRSLSSLAHQTEDSNTLLGGHVSNINNDLGAAELFADRISAMEQMLSFATHDFTRAFGSQFITEDNRFDDYKYESECMRMVATSGRRFESEMDDGDVKDFLGAINKFQEAHKFLVKPLYFNKIYDYRDSILDEVLENYRNAFVLFSAFLGVISLQSREAALNVSNMLQRMFDEDAKGSLALVDTVKDFIDKNITVDEDIAKFGKHLIEKNQQWLPHMQLLIAETLAKSFGVTDMDDSLGGLRKMFEDQGFSGV